MNTTTLLGRLTDEQIAYIIDNKLITECTADEKAQVNEFAFGDEFISSTDKGTLKEY
tara:strand:+ start:817 stop:987 length:171 start_codon:yes stop_codon:yes gene_type:complete